MKKILLSLLSSFCAIFTAQSVNLDSLYKCLDKEINSSSIYVTEHEKAKSEYISRRDKFRLKSNVDAEHDIE